MDQPGEAPLKWDQAEQDARAFHDRETREARILWTDGLNLLLRGLDTFNAHTPLSPEIRATAVLLVQAWNNLYCALDLALRGYYGPAQNLLRIAEEDWLACQYLRLFPKEHPRFIPESPAGPDTPTFNEMLTKIEGSLRQPPDRTIRAVMQQLHKYSHVDRISLGLHLVPSADGTIGIGLGPQQRAGGFWLCTIGATSAISILLDEADAVRQALGDSAIAGIGPFVLRLLAFQASIDRARIRQGLGMDLVAGDP